jgi:peptidoglycan/LPS O-acetylase OafA/YrhL
LDESEVRGRTSSKIDDIQKLRGFAALMSVFAHMPLMTGAFTRNGFSSTPFTMGVPLFFVISGYVMLVSVSRYEFSTRAFYIRRIFRIFPVLILSLAITFPMAWWTESKFFFGSMENLTKVSIAMLGMVYNYAIVGIPVDFGLEHIHNLAGLWSISTEEQFYILFPLLFLMSPKARLAVVLTLIAVWGVGIHLAADLSPNRILFILASHGFRYDLILLGMVIFLLPLRISASPWIVTGGLLVAAVWTMTPQLILHGTVAYWIYAAALVCVVASAAKDRNVIFPKSWFGKFLHYIGDRSYVVYVMHFQILGTLGYFLQKTSLASDPIGYAWALSFAFIPCFVLIEAIHRWIEKPAIRLGYRIAAIYANKAIAPAGPSVPHASSL